MKVQKYKGNDVRRLLTGLITNKVVVGSISEKWEKEGLFDSRWANLIAGWAIRYYRKYNKAPGRQIAQMFDRWSEEGDQDPEIIRMVEKFLTSLSEDYARRKRDVEPRSYIDLAGEYFNKVRLLRLSDAMKADIERGQVEKAQEKFDKSFKIEVATGKSISVFRDKAAVYRAFKEVSKPLIAYPGALGKFFGDSLERDGFISFEGPEKRGKTWILLDVAWQAMKQGNKVAFFEVGDLSEGQIMRRFMIRASGRPLKPTEKDSPLKVPTMLGPPTGTGEGVLPEILHKEYNFTKPLSEKVAWRACQKIVHKYGPKEDQMRLEVHPNSTLSVSGMNRILDGWDRQGWKPDVVVVDYADILAPERGGIDTREQINVTWKGLRTLSQKRHILVVTATQTNAASYEAHTISRKHFSENKLKRAHVTGSVGISQNDEEKEIGVIRFNWLVGREWAYDERKCVYCAGCLGLAAPLMHSTF